jgi:hypothetical protein
MKRTLLLAILIAMPAATLAQTPTPSEKPGSPPAEKPMQHDMQRMRGMMGAMRAPVCLYEGKAFSLGALLSARGIKPVMVCTPIKTAGEHAEHGSGDAHAGHQHGPAPVGWQIYAPAKTAHQH